MSRITRRPTVNSKLKSIFLEHIFLLWIAAPLRCPTAHQFTDCHAGVKASWNIICGLFLVVLELSWRLWCEEWAIVTLSKQLQHRALKGNHRWSSFPPAAPLLVENTCSIADNLRSHPLSAKPSRSLARGPSCWRPPPLHGHVHEHEGGRQTVTVWAARSSQMCVEQLLHHLELLSGRLQGEKSQNLTSVQLQEAGVRFSTSMAHFYPNQRRWMRILFLTDDITVPQWLLFLLFPAMWL